jgi:hypothetical protein
VGVVLSNFILDDIVNLSHLSPCLVNPAYMAGYIYIYCKRSHNLSAVIIVTASFKKIIPFLNSLSVSSSNSFTPYLIT